MSWNRVYQLKEVEKALHNLILARVLLREDLNPGDYDVIVGQGTAGSEGALSGAYLFVNTVTAVKLVQPDSAGTGVEYSEIKTISPPTSSDINLALVGTVSKQYTTARGAYITPVSPPSAVSDLKICDVDPRMLTDPAMILQRLPGVYVRMLGGNLEGESHPTYQGDYNFRVSYVRQVQPDEDVRQTVLYAEDIYNLIAEDHYWGGSVDYGECVSFRPLQGPEGQDRAAIDNLWITWVDMEVRALLNIPINKL